MKLSLQERKYCKVLNFLVQDNHLPTDVYVWTI